MQSNTGMTDYRQIYTDGGCHNGPDDPMHGIGSWAFLEPVDISQGYVDVYGGYMTGVTNNITEMMAVIEGIKHLSDTTNTIHIISDSGYLVKGYTDPTYLQKWISRGWRLASNEPVKNRDLWEELIKLSWHVGLQWTLIKGHMKDKNPIHAFWNDICDKACTFIMTTLPTQGIIYHLRYNFNERQIYVNIGGISNESNISSGC